MADIKLLCAGQCPSFAFAQLNTPKRSRYRNYDLEKKKRKKPQIKVYRLEYFLLYLYKTEVITVDLQRILDAVFGFDFLVLLS